MNSVAEPKMRGGAADQVSLVLVSVLSHLNEAVRVEAVRVGIDIFVRHDGAVGRDLASLFDLEAVAQGEVFMDLAEKVCCGEAWVRKFG